MIFQRIKGVFRLNVQTFEEVEHFVLTPLVTALAF